MQINEITATFTRPADTTAYASGDLVANSTTAGSVTPMSFRTVGGQGYWLSRVALKRSATSVTNASFRLHLYKDSPTCANGDNGAWSTSESGYLGSVDIDGTAPAFTDAAKANNSPTINSNVAPMLILADPDRIVYGLLEARGSYTPSSAEVFTVTLRGEAYV